MPIGPGSSKRDTHINDRRLTLYIEKRYEGLQKDLNKLIDGLAKHDDQAMRDLSSKMVRETSRIHDQDLISLTIISYSLSKIIQKRYYREGRRWPSFLGRVMDNLARASERLQSGDIKAMRESFRTVFNAMVELDAEVGHHVNWVIEKAKIKKASTLYAIGFSIGMSAKLTGASMWEVMDYAGKTKIVDEEKVTRSISSRLELARKVFRVEER